VYKFEYHVNVFLCQRICFGRWLS